MSDRIEVYNLNHPGKSNLVDATKYAAMKAAILATLPAREPGLTIADAASAAKARLSETAFPGGATAGWWFKCVQLDLEARKIVNRSKSSPLRLWRKANS